MLSSGKVEANMPASDLKRARTFYADTLGVTPYTEIDGAMLRYRTDGGTTFNVYQTDFAGTGRHTVAQWHVDDVEAEVRDLQAKGVAFEVYEDMPGVQWNDGVASMEGMGHAAWFKDSEGNILCLDDGIPDS